MNRTRYSVPREARSFFMMAAAFGLLTLFILVLMPWRNMELRDVVYCFFPVTFAMVALSLELAFTVLHLERYMSRAQVDQTDLIKRVIDAFTVELFKVREKITNTQIGHFSILSEGLKKANKKIDDISNTQIGHFSILSEGLKKANKKIDDISKKLDK